MCNDLQVRYEPLRTSRRERIRVRVLSYRAMCGIRTSGKEGNTETRHVDLYTSERAMDKI
jgi:hypothetical protein